MSPLELIDESRQLEAVAVDLGVDRNLTDDERASLLETLALEIRNFSAVSDAVAPLVDRYNSNLYIHMSVLEFHGCQLPQAARIRDEWTLTGYLDLESELATKGPVSVSDMWDVSTTVAHIAVKETARLNVDGFVAEPVRVYKGQFPPVRQLRAGGWGKSYRVNTEYVVFWLWSGNVVSGPAMPLTMQGDESLVHYDGHGISFWPFPAQLVSGRLQSQVKWSMFNEWLAAKAA